MKSILLQILADFITEGSNIIAQWLQLKGISLPSEPNYEQLYAEFKALKNGEDWHVLQSNRFSYLTMIEVLMAYEALDWMQCVLR